VRNNSWRPGCSGHRSLNGHSDLLGAGQDSHLFPVPKLSLIRTGVLGWRRCRHWLVPRCLAVRILGTRLWQLSSKIVRRAVVLGGGGVTGVAWEVGLLLGLAEAGVDLGTADLLVGTSAGSVVAAQVASGVPLEDMFSRQVESASGEIGASIGWSYGLRLL